MSATQLRRPKNRCARPRSSRTVELRLAPQAALRAAAVAGNFTAWVPVEMAPAADGGFVLRVCVQREIELSCRVLVDDERWTVDDITVVDLGRRSLVPNSTAWRTENSAFVRAPAGPGRRSSVVSPAETRDGVGRSPRPVVSMCSITAGRMSTTGGSVPMPNAPGQGSKCCAIRAAISGSASDASAR